MQDKMKKLHFSVIPSLRVILELNIQKYIECFSKKKYMYV